MSDVPMFGPKWDEMEVAAKVISKRWLDLKTKIEKAANSTSNPEAKSAYQMVLYWMKE
jgi:hypothetical protein|tara:strand:+ start:157 stop:330 length:174 start_codon:yes stop_codon:yes gene_type:complete